MPGSAPSAPGMRRINDERDITIIEFEVEKEDVMKFKPIYEAMHQFLTEDGWAHPHTGDDTIEDLFWERWVPSGAKEQHIWWRLYKVPDEHPLIRYFLEVNWQTLNVTKAEVAYKNKKVSGEKIDCIIRFKIYLQWDYGNKFKDSVVWKMKKVFFNKIYNDEIVQHKQELLRFGQKAQRLAKYYFEMAGGEDQPVIFQPPMGYKE